jgi:hypothetical protein
MGRGNPHLFAIIVNSPVNDKRVASMHCRPVESRDTPLSRSQRSADRSSDAHQRDRASTSLIRMPEDPRAAEPRGLESRQILGTTPLWGEGLTLHHRRKHRPRVADQLADGRRFRPLTVVDIHTRECLAMESEQRLKVENVVLALNRIKIQCGVPKCLYCDNGSEFFNKVMHLWVYNNGGRMAFPGQGSPLKVRSWNHSMECVVQNV